jgi:hypothetical protein
VTSETVARPRRPSLLLLAPVVILFALGGIHLLSEAIPQIGDVPWARLVPALIIGALDLAVIPLLLAGRRVGWVLAVSLAGWHLLYRLLQLLGGQDVHLALATVAAVAFLLHTPEMRAVYAEHRDEP